MKIFILLLSVMLKNIGTQGRYCLGIYIFFFFFLLLSFLFEHANLIVICFLLHDKYYIGTN